MKTTTHRTEVTYLVACDCEGCREFSGFPFLILQDYLSSKAQAIREQKKYLPEHPACYLATHLIEPLHPRARTPKVRKAA